MYTHTPYREAPRVSSLRDGFRQGNLRTHGPVALQVDAGRVGRETKGTDLESSVCDDTTLVTET